ncbi:Putative E3 ubiquitin-protein ligase HERC4 [Durusdinium trenchii]
MGSGASAPPKEEQSTLKVSELTEEEQQRVDEAVKKATNETLLQIEKEKKWKTVAEELKPKLAARKCAGEKVLLWISDGILSWPLAANAAKEGVLSLFYPSKEQHTLSDDLVDALKAAEVPEGSLTHVGWMFHGSEMTGEHKEANLKFLAALKPFLTADARVDILACECVAGPTGMKVFQELEKESGINLAASTDMTGNPAAGGNWLLETDGVDVKDTYFTDAIAEFNETLRDWKFHRKWLSKKRRF